jgi:hypothetical protein
MTVDYVSNAKTPAEFKNQVFDLINDKIRLLNNRQINAKLVKDNHAIAFAITELQALGRFLDAIRFEIDHPRAFKGEYIAEHEAGKGWFILHSLTENYVYEGPLHNAAAAQFVAEGFNREQNFAYQDVLRKIPKETPETNVVTFEPKPLGEILKPDEAI